MSHTDYHVRIKDLDRGILVEVTKEVEGMPKIGEGYCEKRSQVPQCIKDIFVKEMKP